MRALVSIVALGLLGMPAMAAELPEWAYPVAPPAGPPPNNTVQKTLAGSSKTYTAAQINDRFGPPDWYPESARVSGLPVGYIMRQLAEFKSGVRKGMRAPVMVQIATALTDEESKAAAEYFASIKYPQFYKVIETDMAPKSFVGAGAMRFAAKEGGTEAIGNM